MDRAFDSIIHKSSLLLTHPRSLCSRRPRSAVALECGIGKRLRSDVKMRLMRERPELSQCLRVLRKGDTLVVWKLDRLARSLKDLVEIVQDLNEREIGFRSLTEAIDTTSSGGRLVFHIFGALAEFEHDLIRERTKAGLQAARARGRKGGRKPSMSMADIRKAAAMLSDPLITKKEVAEFFNVSRTTLNSSLSRLESC